MIIANQPHNPQLPRTLGKAAPEAEKSPWQMDQFELQQEVWDADRKVADLRHQAASGHSRALVGLSVMVTSLTTMVAQSLLSGGSLPGNLLIPLAVGAGAGVTLMGHGVWKRDTAGMEVDFARSEAMHLHKVYEERFQQVGQ